MKFKPSAMSSNLSPALRPLVCTLAAAGIALSLATGPLSAAPEILPPGHPPLSPGVHALVSGKVVAQPGQVLDSATIVIRDGLIEAVGKNVRPPADARVWDMKGTTIYAGLIDPYLTLTTTNLPTAPGSEVPERLTSGHINFFGVRGDERDPGHAGPGYELASMTPEHRVAQGYAGPLATLRALRELGFTAANVVPEKGILRGTSAFVALSDASPNEAVIRPDTFQHVAFEPQAGDDRTYPSSLMGVIAAVRQSFFDAEHYARDQADFLQQPGKRKRPPFNPALEALSQAVGKKMPVIFEPRSALMVDRAARVARELGLRFHLVSSGQEWRRPDLAKATGAAFIVPVNFPILPKLPEEEDWAQVSLDQLRTWDWAAENPAVLRRQGLEIALTTFALSDRKTFRKNLRRALDRGLGEDDALAALTTVPAKLCGLQDRVGTIQSGKLANLTVVDSGSYFDPDRKVREVWIDGRVYRIEPGRLPVSTGKPTVKGKAKTSAKAREAPKPATRSDSEKKHAELRELEKRRVARSPGEGRGPLTEPPAVLVKGATIWTCGPAGKIEDADLLVIDGKVKAVGKSLSVPSPQSDVVVEIDGRGKHLTPGLIDCHSHTAILGGVNEGSIPSSAMCRISDVINSETPNLHQQLAGGLTVANVLHGSANPIGGQNAILKLRDGASPEGLIFAAAPPGIKFALGENVKQSNWGDKNVTRFPQTRMGVRTFMANRFTAARRYRQEWDSYRKSGGVPPRRDLELEAIDEIIQGKRWIHCHSYRQDEILVFLRLMESFGVRVGTLQHILEGYKVADEMAKHGAGASSFSDWWAYKYEVLDAIPYNGSLMRQRRVLVSFNSDSSELARRLYLEAAKAVKYGGTPEEEALKLVTLNPARQLRIDKQVGSLEPGKDADFVLWSHSPLDFRTVCEQTWIEGKQYFDRTLEAERTAALPQERAALIDKARKLARGGPPVGGASGEKSDAIHTGFFQTALETDDSVVVIDCHDCRKEGRGQ